MVEPYYQDEHVTLYNGDVRAVLPELESCSVNCCVTSPPYWGLRDYGHDSQIGLEGTPEEYTAKLVEVFREVRRVLRDDGTLWLNLGMSYCAHPGQRKTTDKAGQKQQTNSASTGTPSRSAVDDSGPTQSPLLWRVPACGSDGKELQDSQSSDRVCPDCGGVLQVANQNHRVRTAHTGQFALQAEPLTSQTIRDNEPADSGQAFPDALLHGVQESTTLRSSGQPLDASYLEATASAFQLAPQTSPAVDSLSSHTKACTCGTSQIPQPLEVRTKDKESFFSACRRSDCRGIGRCGLCWCNLAIPSLNIKPKDEVNIPHLVAMALQADGWYLRQTIIWAKPNPMPESVTDRCTKSHEYIFLMSKSERYYFDQELILEPCSHADEAKYDNGQNGHGGGESHEGQGSSIRKFKGRGGKNSFRGQGHFRDGESGPANRDGRDMQDVGAGLTRNKRSVWTVTTKPYKAAHFATFPPDLIKPCILAGCPEGGTVLDPFGGSGTVASVARQNGRRSVLVELNEKYAKLTLKRLAQKVLF